MSDDDFAMVVLRMRNRIVHARDKYGSSPDIDRLCDNLLRDLRELLLLQMQGIISEIDDAILRSWLAQEQDE